MAFESRLPRLPACQNCFQRKIKCDSNRPKCAPCAKAGSICVNVDPTGNEQLSREYIHELEQQEHNLVSNARELAQTAPCDPPTGPSYASTDHTSKSTEKAPVFVEGGGLSFMRSLFSDTEWRENNADLLHNFARNSPIAETTVRSNSLPSATDARELFDNYLRGSQVHNPFLLRQDVELVFNRVYPSARERASPHDLFRIFIICAIGSVTLHRKGSHSSHPFGYYLAALQYFDKNFLSHGLEAIQNLLLIGRFGIYHHIGTSIWDITQLCIRMCIECRLHKPCFKRTDLLQQQLQRRVFWECYMIDRYSSITLDRPFAIAEKDIQIGLPANASDEEISTAASVYSDLDAFRSRQSISQNEMSTFLARIHLRRITSRIHALFSQFPTLEPTSQSQYLVSGQVYTNLDQVLYDLESWRASCPSIPDPQCLYERQEWFDLLHLRERLLVIRKAIDLVPKRNGLPPTDLLELCWVAATKIINLYTELLRKEYITWTRSYFQMMFTAGLSVLFYLSVVKDMTPVSIDESLMALRSCNETLKFLGWKLPDAQHYVTVFEALLRNISRKGSEGANEDEREASRSNGAEISTVRYQAPEYFPAHQPPTKIHSTESTQQALSSTVHQPRWTVEGLGFGTHDFDDGLSNALDWALLNDDTLWSIESGLGEYAYGDPNANAEIFNSFNFGL